MASIYDKASLVLIPSGTKTSKVYSQKPVSGDGDFTFSRSTMATRVNADGNIEKETQNLLNYSNTFTSWSAGGGTLTSGQTGYDGSSDAWLFTMSSGANICNQANTNGGVQTYSVYAKGSASNGIRLYAFGSTNVNVFFNLNTGAVAAESNNIDASIEDVGSGWYRCSMTYNSTNTNLYLYLTNNSNGNAGSGSVYIQDAQLEQGLVARDYIETTTSAVEGGITDNVPRLDYTDSSCPALLLEPQRTNNIPYSEYQSGGGFSLGTNITWNGFVESLEGYNNASRFTSSTPSASFVQIQNVTIPAGDFTFSMWVKGVSGSFVNRQMYIPSHTGTQATMNEAPVAGEDWKLVYGSGTNTSGSSYTRTITLPFYDQPANAVWEMYGFQLEAGSYATSYIPTYGTSVTRNNEQTYKTSATDLIGQTEGTMYAEFSIDRDYAGTQRILMISNGSNTERIGISIGSTGATGSIYGFLVDNNTTQASIIASGQSQGTHKAAFAYKENDFVFYLDGVQIGTDNNGTICTTDRIDVGRQWDGASFGGDINQTLVFKTRLSNEELADLTTL